MVTREEIQSARLKAKAYLDRAGIVITPRELADMEIADFGLGELEQTGLQIVVYVNTDRVCAKELILFPRQTCPQHKHPSLVGELGKEETFRCRWGRAYLYVPGGPTPKPACRPPKGREAYYTVWHQIVLDPGDQYTLPPDTWHWFQAGEEGAVISEFSTTSHDETDVFTDPAIVRIPDQT